MPTLTNISATLSVTFSSSGFNALQPTSPLQYYTPATGQRAYTLADTLGALNDQINSNTDPTSTGADSPDVLYTFQTASDGMIVIDNITITGSSNKSIWDNGFTYLQGAWQ